MSIQKYIELRKLNLDKMESHEFSYKQEFVAQGMAPMDVGTCAVCGYEIMIVPYYIFNEDIKSCEEYKMEDALG